MPKQQDPCAALPVSTSDQIIPPALLRTPLDREAEALQSLHQPVLDRVDPCLVVAAGVNAGKVTQVGHVLIEVLLEIGDDRVAHGTSVRDVFTQHPSRNCCPAVFPCA
jgi:hypothetical protein